ncbi:hypothetical protein QTP86_025904 [Hemibagrus guttatus]|nr:hypothetical protein QTP86_025904 [Hemibagrus guttatus]
MWEPVPASLQSPSYLISVSRVIRPGVPTTVSITILINSSVLVKSEIIHGNSSLGQAQSIVEGGSTKRQVLPPFPENDSSHRSPYKLIVKGYIGQTLVFSNFTLLPYSPRSVFILLQTDKPKYKPGQDVKIRALVLSPDGKPCDKQIDIIIMDPRENMIRQWLAVDTVLGETAKEFQLSQNPPLGAWKIIATVNVSVLPKFEVLLDAPDVVYYEENLKYTVTAQYLYGKPVAGKMSVVYVHGFQGTTLYEEWKPIEGKAELSFDISSMYQNSDEYTNQFYLGFDAYDYININVQVTELLTGVTYNSSVRVSVVMYRYKLEFQQYLSTIKPSLNFSAQLRLSTYDNSPLTAEDLSQNVTLTVSLEPFSPWMFSWENSAKAKTWNSSYLDFIDSSNLYPDVKVLQLPVPADGIIPFQIELSENVAMLTIEAQYEDIHKSLQLHRRYSSPSRSYIQLRSRSSAQARLILICIFLMNYIGQSLSMTVESNFPLTKVHYMVIAQGQVVVAGTLTSSYFSLSPDPSWVPRAKVLVYCIQPDGEIINDVLDVSFTKILQNHVSLSWEKEQAEPLDHVTLSVSVAEPRSLVGILVVDKASLDSDRGNDFTEKKVMEELATYTTDVSLMDVMEISDPYSVFMVSGITVLTDANLNAENIYASLEFPGDGPMLMMSEQKNQEPHQRRNFPETWLWLDTNISESTTAAFTLTVPDSMTSWVATAFVISENLGLGLSAPAERPPSRNTSKYSMAWAAPGTWSGSAGMEMMKLLVIGINARAFLWAVALPIHQLRVSKDFFVSLNLPSYLVRGELLLLEISLFNYMDLDLVVLLTVDENSMFEFVTSAADEFLLAGMRQVSIGRQASTMVMFAIRATQLGQMPISVKAMGFFASDAVTQTILVKPEGREQSFTQTLFLEFDPMKTSLSREVEFHFPSAAVPGSQRAQVTAVGDILGPSISGLDSLIQMPYGCGEQNMIHFAPNVYVLQYLSRSGRTDEETRTKALSYMTQGYERELSYQRMDGSFSAFGDSDSSGSTWLSAFVLRCFLQAQQFIFIDTVILLRTANWLGAQQQDDGSFAEPGRVIHTELQGGLDGPVSLTAYVLMALLEDVEYKHTYDSEVSAAVNYLTSKLSQGISSNYSLCLVTYALSLAKSPSANIALIELMKRAQIHDGVPRWSTAGSSVSESWQRSSVDIEMASYTLLSLYMLGSDTVIALQALSTFASLSSTVQINLEITVMTQSATVAMFMIDQNNYLLHQSQEIEVEQHLQLNVTATGRGFALFQLMTFYNVETQGLSRRRRAHMCEAFDLYIHVMDIDMYNVNLYICFRLCDNQELNQTGMAILDVGLLTGFSLAQSGVPVNELVRRVETSPGKVILYLDSVTKAEACVEVPNTLEFKVTGVHDAVVTIYDYYEPRRSAVGTYTSETRRDASFCFFCGEDCSQCEDLGISVFDSGISSHHHQGWVQSLTLLLLITFSICF